MLKLIVDSMRRKRAGEIERMLMIGLGVMVFILVLFAIMWAIRQVR